jgi:hypothetical protein
VTLGVAVSLVAFGAIAWILYTPTRSVAVVNDLSYTVSVSNCGDPESVGPGRGTHIQVTASSREATCFVYNSHDHLVGCLHIAHLEALAHLKEMRSCAQSK